MGLKKGDRVRGGRAGWTETGTVTGRRDDSEFEPGEERTVFVKFDDARFTEHEMYVSEVQPE